MDLLQQISLNSQPGPYYQDEEEKPITGFPKVRLVAFYLPQFHPIPENDAWWGKGFTEWTNVTKAIPRFVGHYQPRLPSRFGFYDLRLPQTLVEQSLLAKKYGIGAFCFHHYWFHGRRLLDTPIKTFLSHPEIDIEFCLNWANENWSRRWDGAEHEVLMEQRHSAEDDIDFARSLEVFFADRRYMRVNGRPVLMFYRPSLLPEPKATIERWRNHFLKEGLADPFIVMPQVFEQENPADYGMDAAAGFPPHRFGSISKNSLNGTCEIKLLDQNHYGEIFSYPGMVASALDIRPTEYRLFPGVCPSWDNEARRAGGGRCFAGANPKLYGQWLSEMCRRELAQPDPSSRIVFINAWNEWAEGAHLEPDRHNGYANLAETARALESLHSSEDLPFIAPPVGPRQNALKKVVRRARNKVASSLEKVAKFVRPNAAS